MSNKTRKSLVSETGYDLLKWIYVLAAQQQASSHIYIDTKSPSLFLNLDNKIKSKVRTSIMKSLYMVQKSGMLVKLENRYFVTPTLISLATIVLGQTVVFSASDIYQVLVKQNLSLKDSNFEVIQIHNILCALTNTGLIDYVSTSSKTLSFKVDGAFLQMYRSSPPNWVFYISEMPYLLVPQGIYKYEVPPTLATSTQPSIPQVPQPVVPVKSNLQSGTQMPSSHQNPNHVDRFNGSTDKPLSAKPKFKWSLDNISDKLKQLFSAVTVLPQLSGSVNSGAVIVRQTPKQASAKIPLSTIVTNQYIVDVLTAMKYNLPLPALSVERYQVYNCDGGLSNSTIHNLRHRLIRFGFGQPALKQGGCELTSSFKMLLAIVYNTEVNKRLDIEEIKKQIQKIKSQSLDFQVQEFLRIMMLVGLVKRFAVSESRSNESVYVRSNFKLD